MKFLIGLLLSSSVSAATIGQFISTPEGTSVQTFSVTKKKAVYSKKSNFFDQKKDLSLGKFELVETKSAAKEEQALQEALAKVKEVDKFLKQKNSSFNDFSSKKPHSSFIVLNDYRITQDSTLYPELKQIYDSLAEKKWKHVNGVRLSEDMKTIINVKNGKDVSKEPFHIHTRCKKVELPTYCFFKDGWIFLQ